MHAPEFTRRALLAAAAATSLPHCGVAQQKHPRIRVGQIGTKHAHAAGKLQSLRGLGDLYELVGVVEPDDVRRQTVASTAPYRGVRWMSQDELLNDDGVDVITVETEVTRLVPTAIECIRAGKHIHLDKPAGASMSAYRRLRELADEKRRTVQMGYMLRYNPAFEFLFRVAEEGWLGEITEVTGAMGKMADDAMRRELAEFEGGGMFELACHLIDAVVTLLGKPIRIDSIAHRTRPETDTFADNQLAVFDYPHAIATIRCNHLDPFGFPRRHFNVAGEMGAVEINPLEPPALKLSLDRPRGDYAKGTRQVPLPTKTGRYDDEFRDLARVVRGEKELAWDTEHDLTVHEAVLRGSGMAID